MSELQRKVALAMVIGTLAIGFANTVLNRGIDFQILSMLAIIAVVLIVRKDSQK